MMNLAAVALCTTLLWAQSKQSLMKSSVPVDPDLSAYTSLNVNNFVAWQRYDGLSMHAPTGLGGGIFPKGTAIAVYQDGILWGAKAFTDATMLSTAYVPMPYSPGIRVGGFTYNNGMKAGALVGGEPSAIPEVLNPTVRIYRIRRSYADMDRDEYADDAAVLWQTTRENVTDEMIDHVRERYAADWSEWPVAKGAPYIERNGIPGYQAPPSFSDTFGPADLITGSYDEPGICGVDTDAPADQVIWLVANDYDIESVQGLYGSYPVGVEMQKTLWAYTSRSELDDVIFARVKLANKGGAITVDKATRGSLWLDSVFISQWADPDIGDSQNDVVGCDSLIDLVFAYNSTPADREYTKYDSPPPSIGYALLQGPLVDSSADTAWFDFKRIRDKRNLRMTSMMYYPGEPSLGEWGFTAEGGTRIWRMLRGYLFDTYTEPLRMHPQPPGTPPTFFPLSGDPVNGTGVLDGLGTSYSFQPGQRRMMLNSGPFRLLPGEAQEIVVAIVGGFGADRLSSVAMMKKNAIAARNVYRSGLAGIVMPSPTVDVSEMDRKVILNWAIDDEKIRRTERTIGAYAFEGYRIYQFPDRRSSAEEGKRLLEADVNSVFGDNVGLTRTFVFQRDLLQKDESRQLVLQNGREYYLAVTSYRRSKDGVIPMEIESPIKIFSVVPQRPKPGEWSDAEFGDTVRIVHSSGSARANVNVMVVDPKRLVGHDYEIRSIVSDSIDVEDGSGGMFRVPNPQWFVCDVTDGAVVRHKSSTYSDEPLVPTIHGLQLLFNTRPYIRFGLGQEIASHTPLPQWRPVNWAGRQTLIGSFGVALGIAGEFRGSSLTYVQASRDVEIRFSSATRQRAFKFLRVASTSGATYAGYYDQPFTVWDITDSALPRQIGFMFMEQSDNAENDNVWGPGTTQSAREYFYILNSDYSPTDNSGWTIGITTEGQVTSSLPILYGGQFVRTVGTPRYSEGDVYRIEATAAHLLTPSDRWRFSTVGIAPTYDAVRAKQDVRRVNVFPNPYIASMSSNPGPLQSFVTFNGLPVAATIRIFNVAGHLVRTMNKLDASQFLRWDLRNERGLTVASGIYIAHIDMSDLGAKVLKLAIIQEERVP